MLLAALSDRTQKTTTPNSPLPFTFPCTRKCPSLRTLISIFFSLKGTSPDTSRTSYHPSYTCVLISLHHPSFSPSRLLRTLPLQIRPLASTDYERGHLSILSVLTLTPDVGAAAWTSQFHALKTTPNTYYILVVVSRETDRIVGTGSVFFERKFLRGLGRVGHIEDIAVAREMQGKKLGLRIIEALTYISETAGCYKTILDCSEKNVRAYRPY